MTNEKLEEKCLFCTLGKKDRRGIISISEKIQQDVDEMDIYEIDNESTKINYKCALGKVGEECIIPRLYNLIKNTNYKTPTELIKF